MNNLQQQEVFTKKGLSVGEHPSDCESPLFTPLDTTPLELKECGFKFVYKRIDPNYAEKLVEDLK